jgi:hypothetical protein
VQKPNTPWVETVWNLLEEVRELGGQGLGFIFPLAEASILILRAGLPVLWKTPPAHLGHPS